MTDIELSSENLIAINDESTFQLPFFIDAGSSRLECLELLRLLAGKRLVCKGSYQGQTVLLKVFFGASYIRRYQREFDGVRLIRREGINTPRLIASNINRQGKLAYIVFEYIEKVESLDDRLKQAPTVEQRITVFQQALTLIAQMHMASIYQRDVHLDNFLVDDSTVYLIDGDQVEKEKGENGLAQSFVVKNLAMFFTQLTPWEQSHIEPLLDFYVESRAQHFPASFYNDIKQQLAEYKQWREKKYIEKKVFRRCSAFDVIKNWHTFCVFSRELDKDLVDCFIESPDSLIEQGAVLKSGRTAIVVRIDINGKSYVLKRYNKKAWLHQAIRSVMKSKAAMAWQNGHLLLFNGVPTARPLLLMEHRFGGLKGVSYLITEYIDGVRACDYFSQDNGSEELAKEVNDLVNRLHLSGFSHGDLKSHNILISNSEAFLIDLDGMNKLKSGSEAGKCNDWSRLYRDLGKSKAAEILFKGVEL